MDTVLNSCTADSFWEAIVFFQKLRVRVCLLCLFLISASQAIAQVSGVCSNCHTMHNSQNGSIVNDEGPAGNLLNTDCVGCHSSVEAVTIVELGSTIRIPIVFNQSEPVYPPSGTESSTLAGGNFYWVSQGGPVADTYGHNVFGISAADGNLDKAPGSTVNQEGCKACHSSLASAEPINGCRGCHVPHHHASDSATVVDGAGGWYRFLGDNPGMPGLNEGYGVVGIEATDWERDPAASLNVYKGTLAMGTQKRNFSYSIGEFCVGCHGNFHHDMTDADGAWIRHPSDVVIPNSGEYANYTTYNSITPVARTTDLTGIVPAEVSPGSDVVTCISCHRAHGSPYPDMLRWDYQNDCNAGEVNADCGCFTCHAAKDD